MRTWVFALVGVVSMLASARGFGATCSSLSLRAGFRSRSRMATSMASVYTESAPVTLKLSAAQKLSFKGDLLIIPFYKPVIETPKKDKDLEAAASEMADALKSSINDELSVEMKKFVSEVLDEKTFKAETSSKQVVRMGNTAEGVKYVALVGLGPKPKTVQDLEVMSANRLGKLVANIAKEVNAESVGVAMVEGVNNAGLSQLILGVHDASYKDNRFRKAPEGGFPPMKFKDLSLLGCTDAVVKDIELTNKLTEMIASGVKFAKDLVNAPACYKTPLVIADLAKTMATEHNIEFKLLQQAECEALGMGAYLGVQQGSKFPPQFIHLTYKPEGASADVQKIALIGKGLTFDSGGYNIKLSMMELMKFDMGGCAAILGACKAISQLRPRNIEVHFISAVCENMVSAEAVRPGDILVASNGKTIEVMNTDAEGRLTLADALVYAENLGVDTIVDMATLTGAQIVALGEKVAALYTADEELLNEILSAAKRTDEGIWQLPLEPKYKEMIKGSLGDLKNIGGKGGGSITAALFLQEFVDKPKWAHIDMAGPVWDNGATGYGVKMLVDFVLNKKSVPAK